MQEMFQDKGYDQECAGLIFSFLHQYDVLLPVDKETALVPSMISPIPVVRWIDGWIDGRMEGSFQLIINFYNGLIAGLL